MPVFDEKKKMRLLNDVLDQLDRRVMAAFPMRIEGGHKAAFELLTAPEHRQVLMDAYDIAPLGIQKSWISTIVHDTNGAQHHVIIKFKDTYRMPVPHYAAEALQYDRHGDILPRIASWIDIQFKLRGALALAKDWLEWANWSMEEPDLRLYFPGVLALMNDPQLDVQKARMAKPKVTGYRPPQWAIDGGQEATRAISKAMLLHPAEGSNEIYFQLTRDETNQIVTPLGKSISLLN